MLLSTKLVSFLATATYLIQPLTALPAPDALAEAFPEALAEAEPVDDLIARAPKAKTQNICVGDSRGTNAAFYSCVNVVWSPGKKKAVVKHTVKDSRGDSKGTYGSYKVYWADGEIDPSARLNNNKGVGKTTSAAAKTWTRNEFITGIRVEGCVNNKLGKDTCKNVFKPNPFR